MEVTKSILLALAVILLTSAQTDGRMCHDRIFQCIRSHGLFPRLRVSDNLGAVMNNVNASCIIYQNFVNCIDACSDVCIGDYRDYYEEFYFWANFTCSEEGRSMAEAARSSVCFNDEMKEIEIYVASSACSDTNRPSDRCQQMILTRECQIQTARDLCGQEFAVAFDTFHAYEVIIQKCFRGGYF